MRRWLRLAGLVAVWAAVAVALLWAVMVAGSAGGGPGG